ncbi:MAG: UpxY family transcription antiterminator [Bacteroidetes bacterium]|nr:UpxY family transcription antiterminator [Bacteroidota bacterium]
MEKNWHILYTRPSTEKKVAATLAKRKVEGFLPICNKEKNEVFLSKQGKEPLFAGYVFVYVPTEMLEDVQKASGAVSLVYWKGKPAIVSESDIQQIKNFVELHSTVELLPIDVNSKEERSHINKSPIVVGNKKSSTFSQTFRVILPTLGYILSAKGEMRFNTNVIHLNERALN